MRQALAQQVARHRVGESHLMPARRDAHERHARRLVHVIEWRVIDLDEALRLEPEPLAAEVLNRKLAPRCRAAVIVDQHGICGTVGAVRVRRWPIALRPSSLADNCG